MIKSGFLSVAAFVTMTACATAPYSDPLAGQRLAPPPVDYSALLTHPDRPAADLTDDALRKPAAVLEFAGVTYGMTVVELEAGGGYYTELLAHAVGPDGRVYMQNPQEFDAFAGPAIEARVADGRLSNVELMRTHFDEITVEDNTVDLVTWFLGPHELWFQPSGPAEDVFGNPDDTFQEIARVLKPGGSLVLLDHSAPEGAGVETGNETHRIDPAIIVALAEGAGLVVSDKSDLLAQPDDPLDVHVFDPSVRRKTDRFLIRLEKSSD